MDTKLFNKKSIKITRKQLRSNMPKPEAIMWFRLKNKQINGYKFRRQYSIGPFVVDFYCPRLKLAIEIDGDSHFYKKSRGYDKERQNYIESKGVNFLRFTNNEVLKNINGVVEVLLERTSNPL